MPAIKTKEPTSFKQAMEELEGLVAQGEGKELDIEQQISAFERGQVLAQFCKKRLAEMEVRIKEVQEKYAE